jgi:hypothetical protein
MAAMSHGAILLSLLLYQGYSTLSTCVKHTQASGPALIQSFITSCINHIPLAPLASHSARANPVPLVF